MNAKTEQKKAPAPEAEQEKAPAPEAEQEKAPAKRVPGLRVTTKRDGFRRGGRAWHGSTEIAAAALTAEQIAQVKAEPLLTVEEIEIEQ